MTAGGRFRIRPDEAVVCTATEAGANFRNVVIGEGYWRTLNYWDRQTSLNSAQMAADEDGCFTYVVAHQDPGVYNWLDTCGLGHFRFGQRWQAFDPARRQTPALSARVVKFADLEWELPPGVRRIDAPGRKAQMARRQAGFRQRFLDH